MKTYKGVVVSAKSIKTVVVKVKRFKVHPLYQKRINVVKKYHVHNEIGAKEGDLVKFVETRPISKTKKWKVVEVLKK